MKASFKATRTSSGSNNFLALTRRGGPRMLRSMNSMYLRRCSHLLILQVCC